MSNKKRNIFVVRGSRDDYSLLKSIEKNGKGFFNLKKVVRGFNLLKKHGNIIQDIKNDGLNIDVKIKVNLKIIVNLT